MLGTSPDRRPPSQRVTGALTLPIALMAAGCGGSASVIQEAGTAAPLTAGSVDVQPVGDPLIELAAPATGAQAGQPPRAPVTFSVDDSGLLLVTVTVHSKESARTDILLTADCYDVNRIKIATATGGAVFLEPGTTTSITLSANRPSSTIKAATIHIATHLSIPGPTPTP